MKTYCIEHQIRSLPSLFWPLFHSGSQNLAPVKNRRFLRFFHNNNNYHNPALLQAGFSENTEAITTSRIPIDATLPEIFAFL